MEWQSAQSFTISELLYATDEPANKPCTLARNAHADPRNEKLKVKLEQPSKITTVLFDGDEHAIFFNCDFD